MIFIFRKDGSDWRILYLNPDVPTLDPKLVQDFNANLEFLRAFDSRIVSDRPEPPPPAAVLLGPPDRAVLPRFSARPEISWQSEASSDAAFIVESQFTNPRDEVNWSVSNLTFAQISRSAQPFKEGAPFGVGMQPHRWRIWTLGQSGAVSISQWRTLIYSN